MALLLMLRVVRGCTPSRHPVLVDFGCVVGGRVDNLLFEHTIVADSRLPVDRGRSENDFELSVEFILKLLGGELRMKLAKLKPEIGGNRHLPLRDGDGGRPGASRTHVDITRLLHLDT